MLLRVVTLAALAFGLVAPAQAQPAALKLLVWINGDKGYNGLQKVGDAFAAESGVQVIVQHPEGAPDKFTASAAAGKGPDIFCWPHDRVGEWAKSGLIVPVKPPRRVREQIEDSAWKAFTYRGQVWGYPLAIEAIGLIYNKALVKTPPATWDEVIALDQQLAKEGRKAILWDYNKSFFTWPMLAGPGGFVFGRKPDGDLDPQVVGINSPGALQGALMLEKLITGGTLPRGARYSDMEAQFASGKVAMMISGPWAWDNVQKSRIDFGVANIPGFTGKPARPAWSRRRAS
jgi:maltose/maltodextrin transport system substrate-binding protein